MYIGAKERYKSFIMFFDEEIMYPGLCSCISLGIIGSFYIRDFPEFRKIKPKNKSIYGYWWPINDIASRVEALDIMIAMTD